MIESTPESRREVSSQKPLSACVVLNPRAGRGAAQRRRTELERGLVARGIAYDVRATDEPGHAAVLAETAALEGVDTIVACGGDGTVNEVASGVLRAYEREPDLRAAMAVVPIGTGNDFAKLLGVTGRMENAVHAIAQRSVHRFDTGIVTWEGGSGVFVNAMGTGIDVEVVRQILRSRQLPGALLYVAGLVKALRRYDPIPVRLRVNDREIETRVMMVAVSNGRCVGGSFHICPDAKPDDGLFDVCIIDAVPLHRTPALVARILAGRHRGHDAVEFLRASVVDIDVPEGTPLFFQLDGELHEPVGVHSIRVALRPASLPVVTNG